MSKNLITQGPTLVQLVGPAAAGKSHFAEQFPQREVVSTDALRHELGGDFRRQDINDLVNNEFDRRIRTRLEAGLRVVADATHIKDTDRRRTAKLAAKYGAKVIYVVIDRPLMTKIKHAGWRADVYKNGKPLVIAHDDTFRANEGKILNGDGIAHVIDTRKVVPEIVLPLCRDSEQATLMDIYSRNYKGILVIGDVHGNMVGLRKMLDYADANNLFMLFLGDIVDYDQQTLKAASLVSDILFRGMGASILGNHEKKILKWVLCERINGIFANDARRDAAQLERAFAMSEGLLLTDQEVMQRIGPGFKGDLTAGNDVTVNQVKAMTTEDRLRWETKFIGMCELMPHTIRLPRYFFTHGAVNARMLEMTDYRFAPETTEESFACYGQTTGRIINGYPERLYDWMDEIPPRQTVVVGHECKQQTFPLVQVGKAGGRIVFLDTGSSKPDRFPEGRLSAMVLDIVSKKREGLVLENERFITEYDL